MLKFFSTWKGRLVTLAALAFCAGAAFTFLKKPPNPDDDYLPHRHLLPQNPVIDFTVKKVKEALKDLDPAELVLGVSIGKESRAYPINMLNQVPANKILNDTLGGRPIAATWCDHAHNAIVYSREVEGRTLTFGIAGQLWKGSMVLYDQETGTRWSHILGLGKIGPLKGKTLLPFPSLVTDWQTWRRLHPEGTVVSLPRERKDFSKKIYQERDLYLIGIASEGKVRTWSFTELEKVRLLNDTWNDQPILVVFEPATSTARLFHRTVQGQVLTFQLSRDSLVDEETGTSWELITGQARSGQLAGRQLSPLPAIVSYRNIWENFFPRSRSSR